MKSSLSYCSEEQKIIYENLILDEINNMNKLVDNLNEYLSTTNLYMFEDSIGDHFARALQSGHVTYQEVISYFREQDVEYKIGIREEDYINSDKIECIREVIKEDIRLEENTNTRDKQWFIHSNRNNSRLAPWEHSVEKYSQFDPSFRKDYNPIFKPQSYKVTINTKVPVYNNGKTINNNESLYIPNIRIIVDESFKIPKHYGTILGDVNWEPVEIIGAVRVKHVKCMLKNFEKDKVVLRYIYKEQYPGYNKQCIKHVKVLRKFEADISYYIEQGDIKMRKYVNTQKMYYETEENSDKNEEGNIIRKGRVYNKYISFEYVCIVKSYYTKEELKQTKLINYVMEGGIPFIGPKNPETNRFYYSSKQLGTPVNALYQCQKCNHKFRAIDATVCIECKSEYITYNRYKCLDCNNQFFDHNYAFPEEGKVVLYILKETNFNGNKYHYYKLAEEDEINDENILTGIYRQKYTVRRTGNPRCQCNSTNIINTSNTKVLGYNPNASYSVTGLWGTMLRKRFIKDMNDGNVKICKKPTFVNGIRTVKAQAYRVYASRFKMNNVLYERNVLVFADISNPENRSIFASDKDRVPINYALGSDYHQGMLPHRILKYD